MTHLSWNLVDDWRQLLQYPFMVNALRAGTIVAVLAGAVGYLMVLRRQSFAGHTLAVAGFPGAAGAVWLGLDPSVGFYAFCVGGALVVGALTPSGRPDAGDAASSDQSAVIGTVQAFALAAGMLFVSLYHGFQGGLTSLLFGTIIGVTTAQVRTLLLVAAIGLAALAALGRPLLYSTLDPESAAARGVRTKAIGVAFLLLLGLASAGVGQVTGSLLVFALLVAPAATAARITSRPAHGIAVSVAVALLVTWVGEAAAYFSPFPIGFWVTTLAFGAYLLAGTAPTLLQRASRRAAGART